MAIVRLTIVRLMLLLVAVQVSGAPAVCADQCGVADRDCPLEKAGKTCAAGCPGCHVVAQGALRAPSSLVIEPATASITVLPVYETTEPRAPALPGLYRPPRSLS
jgi:hypothetical protein